jgi:hypothetical protein
VVHALEYLGPSRGARQTLVFDEFHHGYGMHGGSFVAISRYLSTTRSGHFLAQALVAALVLLLAAAPRPIIPQDPERVVRRSPLEHAEALGNAYADVRATKTAAARLVGGLRRRVGRTVAVSASAADVEFLDRAAARSPALSKDVEVVKRALREQMAVKEFSTVGDALREIEQALLTTPPTRS